MIANQLIILFVCQARDEGNRDVSAGQRDTGRPAGGRQYFAGDAAPAAISLSLIHDEKRTANTSQSSRDLAAPHLHVNNSLV